MEVSYFKRILSFQQVINLLERVYGRSYYVSNSQSSFEVRGVCDGRKGGMNAIAFSPSICVVEAERKLKNCIVLTEERVDGSGTGNVYVSVGDARGAFIRLLEAIVREVGVQPFTSVMSSDMSVSPLASIHSSACIEEGVRIEDGVVISAGCVIKSGTQIGRGSVVRENCVIGSDGISVYKSKAGDVLRFPHVCGVVVGENTEIGAGCVIPRGMLSSTRIGNDVIVGNLSNIGHGAVVEDDVWMSVGSLVGGHAHIGRQATIGMGVRVRDNQIVGEEASIGMGSVVVKAVEPRSSVFGNPAKRMPALSTGPNR